MSSYSTGSTGGSAGTRTTEDAGQLFSNYIDLCNRAIAENDDKIWFREAKRLSAMLCGGASFRTLIYDQDPTSPIAEFHVHFDPTDQLLEILPAQQHAVVFTWRAPLDYLHDVVHERPDMYLQNPLLLDWTWIRARAEDEAARYVTPRTVAIAFGVGALLGILRRRR
jgi:hypothetical protein